MNISKELQEKINLMFKNNEELRKRLLVGDANAIREVGSLSQKGINPEDIVDAYESNDSETMKYLYKKAQIQIELQKLYRELCLGYYNSIRDKGDDSSIYVYNKSSKTVEVKVWGEFDWLFPAFYDITWCNGYEDISTSEWRVPRYSERFIPQYINEREFKYAHVHFTTSGTNGLWSADSSGWYPNADT